MNLQLKTTLLTPQDTGRHGTGMDAGTHTELGRVLSQRVG